MIRPERDRPPKLNELNQLVFKGSSLTQDNIIFISGYTTYKFRWAYTETINGFFWKFLAQQTASHTRISLRPLNTTTIHSPKFLIRLSNANIRFPNLSTFDIEDNWRKL